MIEGEPSITPEDRGLRESGTICGAATYHPPFSLALNGSIQHISANNDLELVISNDDAVDGSLRIWGTVFTEHGRHELTDIASANLSSHQDSHTLSLSAQKLGLPQATQDWTGTLSLMAELTYADSGSKMDPNSRTVG